MRKINLIVILAGLALALLTSHAAAMYNPTLGRWAERDPMGYMDAFNVYGYVVSNPLSGVDSTGLGIIIPGGSYSHGKDAKPELWNDTVIAAFAALCPCAKYTNDDLRKGEVQGVTRHLARTYVMASESDKPEHQGKGFCKCLDDHKAGCTLLHDLITSQSDYSLQNAPALTGEHAASFELSQGKDDFGDPLPGTVKWNPAYYGDKGIRSSDDSTYEGVNGVDSHVVLAMELSHAWLDQMQQAHPGGIDIGFYSHWPDGWPNAGAGTKWTAEAFGVVVQNQVFHELVKSTDNKMNYNWTNKDLSGKITPASAPITWYKTKQDFDHKPPLNPQDAGVPYFGKCNCDTYKLPWKRPS